MMNQERIEIMLETLSNIEAVRHLKSDNLKHFAKVSPKEARVVFADKNVRRVVKKHMKEAILLRFENWRMEHADLINYWNNVPEDGESQGRVWIIKGDINHAKKVLEELGQPWEGVHINSPYDCTGQWFAWEADFVQLADRVFVTQHWGLDV